MVFLGQPFKKGFHRHHAGVLAVGTQGITVLFTVVMQVLLITLQNRLGDVLGPDDGPLVAPVNKVAQVLPAGAYGVGGILFDRHPLEAAFGISC